MQLLPVAGAGSQRAGMLAAAGLDLMEGLVLFVGGSGASMVQWHASIRVQTDLPCGPSQHSPFSPGVDGCCLVCCRYSRARQADKWDVQAGRGGHAAVARAQPQRRGQWAGSHTTATTRMQISHVVWDNETGGCRQTVAPREGSIKELVVPQTQHRGIGSADSCQGRGGALLRHNASSRHGVHPVAATTTRLHERAVTEHI